MVRICNKRCTGKKNINKYDFGRIVIVIEDYILGRVHSYSSSSLESLKMALYLELFVIESSLNMIFEDIPNYSILPYDNRAANNSHQALQ